jgi:hypothetical protein
MDRLPLAVEEHQCLVEAQAAQIEIGCAGVTVLSAERVGAVLRAEINHHVVDDIGDRG